MGFASPRAPNQYDVLGTVHELAPMKLAHRGLVDLTGRKVEAREVLVGREASGLHMIGNGAHLTFCDLSLQQLGEHRHCGVECRCALFHEVCHGMRHPVHLQTARAMMMAPLAGS
jgi:hypothetical protein